MSHTDFWFHKYRTSRCSENATDSLLGRDRRTSSQCKCGSQIDVQGLHVLFYSPLLFIHFTFLPLSHISVEYLRVNAVNASHLENMEFRFIYPLLFFKPLHCWPQELTTFHWITLITQTASRVWYLLPYEWEWALCSWGIAQKFPPGVRITRGVGQGWS